MNKQLQADESLVLEKSRAIEKTLRQDFGATGEGLGRYASSVKDKLPFGTIKKIWRIARIRNRVIHHGKTLKSRSRFVELCDEVSHELTTQTEAKISRTNSLALGGTCPYCGRRAIKLAGGAGVMIPDKYCIHCNPALTELNQVSQQILG